MVKRALTLAVCLFANQAGTLVLSPILVSVARDFEVSTAAAGQLRSIAGAVAGATALGVAPVAVRVGLKRLLVAGLAFLALAAGISAAAPSFAVLAAAQALVGIAVAVLLSGAVAGVATWIEPGRRADALSIVFGGQAAAWLLGMPVVGVVGEVSWRLAWIVLPLGAAACALVLVLRLPDIRLPAAASAGGLRLVLRDRIVGAWALGELLAFSAWTGMLVYSGALLIESYGISLRSTGMLLGLVFVAYFPSSLVFRRWVDRAPGPLIVGLALCAACVAALIGVVRPAVWVSVLLLSAYVFLNAGRTISGSAFGLDAAPGKAVTAMGVRASATQFGYLVGGALGGIALHFGGYPALGLTFAALYVLAVVPYAVLLLTEPRALGLRP
jgi:predicted MFS family arabinose efflux permease